MNLILGKRNDNVGYCVCGHSEDEHNGHTHAVFSQEPHHCSQGCGCKNHETKVPFLDPGEYGKMNGVWYCMPPKKKHFLISLPNNCVVDISEKLIGCLSGHKVVEHEDGTITVSPSILISYSGGEGDFSWHGFLERGIWRECV